MICFHLTNFFGEEKFSWLLPTKKSGWWKYAFSETHKFSRQITTQPENCKSQLCAMLQWPKIADTQEILYLCVYSSDSWGWRMRSRSFNEPVTCFHEFCSNERLPKYIYRHFCRFFEYMLTYLVEKQNEEYVFSRTFFL